MKPVHTRPQFSIATIFLAMTLVAISLAVVGNVPCLGFLLLFVGPPACLRAAVVGYQCRRAGISLSVGEKIEIIVQSVYAATVSLAVGAFCGVVVWMTISTVPFVLLPGTHPDLVFAALCVLAGILSGLAAFGFSFWSWTMSPNGSQDAK